ncbi:tail fiber protein [Sphingomonas sp. AOB5]|uniref:phage tail protein n=1 Tax=Sphingomonas sp. AOB5 TaxID=3034017 RepID=UPI0023F68580|nr:tail fiber protein [Sphingomonas sp. AOB5]MDF7775186.1 tail fiber protein [Sphingomonas sp. AOB5]
MSATYVGEIRPFGGNYAPEGWLLCDGSLLQINDYEVLFNLIGVTYGGDGMNNFALPDLRGRTIVGASADLPADGPLSPRALGENGGLSDVFLRPSQMPSHSHPAFATTLPATDKTPMSLPAASANGLYLPSTATEPKDALLDWGTIGMAGGGQAHENCMPSVAISYIISNTGLYPARGG